jgi:hypothetical protein
LVAVIESRNIAAIMDGSGFSPPAASSVAFNTMKAAATGTKCDTTMDTKFWNAWASVDIQLDEMPPGLSGT